jgi:hypothetical protein
MEIYWKGSISNLAVHRLPNQQLKLTVKARVQFTAREGL